MVHPRPPEWTDGDFERNLLYAFEAYVVNPQWPQVCRSPCWAMKYPLPHLGHSFLSLVSEPSSAL